MPTGLYLVRHADYALVDSALGGRAAHPLSDAGRRQAATLAQDFSARAVAAVVASPVRRAVETAAPIAARLGLVVQHEPAFAEIDYGGWTGRSFAALRNDPAWCAWNAFRSTAPVPDGESMLAVQARAVAGLLRLADRHRDAQVIVISHGDVLKAMLAHFLGMPLDMIRRIRIAPAAISHVVLHASDVEVLEVNRTLTDPPGPGR